VHFPTIPLFQIDPDWSGIRIREHIWRERKIKRKKEINKDIMHILSF
jgi:hypothetical protein